MDAARELLLLGCAIVIGIVQLLWAAVAARRQQNLQWASGPRDEPMPISGVAARLDRAFRNFMETFPLFAVAILTAAQLGTFGPLTLWGAGIYVAMRAIYVPIYASGVAKIRSLVWMLSLLGLLMVVAGIFL